MSLLRTRPLVGLAPLLVVVAVAAWLLLREDDPLDPVRELDAVESADDRTIGSGISVTLRRGSDAADVTAVLDALPEGTRGGLRIGEARLELDRSRRQARQAAPALVTASKVRARIEIDTRGGEGELETWVRQSHHAAPVARAILAAGIGPGEGVGTVEVKVERPARRYGETPIALSLWGAADLAPAAVDAADALASRGVQVSTRGGRLELRVRAEDSAGAADAFRAANAALDDLDDEQRREVAVYVDVPDPDGGEWSTVPVLGGVPGTSPDRAAALLRRLEADGAETFVDTDMEYVRARLPSRRGTLAAAQAARAAGAERIEVEWDLATPRDWLAPVAEARQDEAIVDDTAAATVRVLRGAEQARAAGIEGVRWIHDIEAGEGPRLTVTRPGWIAGTSPLADEGPDDLRRLFRAVRTVDWPGAAFLQVSLGPDACGKGTNRYASMSFEATSTGRAWKSRGGSSCDVEDQMETVRKAWDATAR